MGLEGFDITEEIFEKHKSIFFLLINPTYTDYIMQGEEAQRFAQVFQNVKKNQPNKENIAEFLNFLPIRILWESQGSQEFQGYGNSEELKDLFDQKKGHFVHYVSEVDGQKIIPYTNKNMESIRKHLQSIQKDFKNDYKPFHF